MKALSATFALAVVLSVAGTGTAHAITHTTYDVTIEGEATYARTDVWPSPPLGQWEQRASATFKWKTRVPSVTFIDKHVGATSNASTTVTQADAKLHVTIPTAEGPKTGLCTGTTGDASPGWLGAGLIPTPDPNVESLDVRVLGGVSFHLPSCSGTFGAGPQSFGIGGSDKQIPHGPFDEPFEMPHEAIGMGKIIQLLESSATGSKCPGYADGTASCVLSWRATVTFVRTAQWDSGSGGGGQPDSGDDGLDESVIPLPPKPQPSSDLDESLIPMPPKRAKLTAGARRAKLSLTCSVACSGTATAYPRQRGAAAAGRPLARVRFKGAARRPTTVVLRFGPSARRAIRRAGGVRLQLRVSPQAGGDPVRRTVALRLPGARR
jgi:hypothetical protein